MHGILRGYDAPPTPDEECALGAGAPLKTLCFLLLEMMAFVVMMVIRVVDAAFFFTSLLVN